MGVTLYNDQKVGTDGPERDDNAVSETVEFDGQSYVLGPNQTLNVADDGNALSAVTRAEDLPDTVAELSGEEGGPVEGVQRS